MSSSRGQRRVSIHQPAYFPWFGLIDKIARSDLFVVLDQVQYSPRAFQHRTLYSCAGGPRYLSLSVDSKGHRSRRIGEIRLADPAMPARHLETLRHRYGKRPGWRRLQEPLSGLLRAPHERLLDLTLATLRLTLDVFEIDTPLRLASELLADGAKTELMVSLTLSAGGTEYLSGRGAMAYLQEERFAAAGLGLVYQDFVHPTYLQQPGGSFQPGCLALEWVLEAGDAAVDGFWAHLGSTGAPSLPSGRSRGAARAARSR